jgi:perosamine synthetase
LLSGLEDKVILPLDKTDFADNIYWVFGMILKDSAKMNAKEIMEKLSSKGIGSRPFFYPMHLQPVYNKMGWYTNESYKNAEKMAEYGFYIPSGLGITNDEIKEVARIVREILA